MEEFRNYLHENAYISRSKIKISTISLNQMQGIFSRNEKFSNIQFIHIFGFDNSLKVRSFLRKIYSQNTKLEKIRRFTIQEWSEFFNETHPKPLISFIQFSKSALRKLSYGYFQETPFFLQFNDKKCVESKKIRDIYHLGRIRLQAQVIDDEFWWSYPSRIGFGNSKIESLDVSNKGKELLQQFKLDPKDVNRIFTVSPIFSENIRLLEHFRCQGNLELIKSSEGDYKQQLRINLISPETDFLYII